MRKIIMMAVMILSVVFAASARDEYSRDVKILPPAAQTMLKNNFKAAVNHIKIDRELGQIKDYTVVLNDGSEIDFDRHGNWKDVEVSFDKSVPATLIPSKITEFVKTRHKGARIIGIEKDRRGYDVELTTGVEMKFDSEGVFKNYDR